MSRQPLTPPADTNSIHQRIQPEQDVCASYTAAAGDNTAAGMAMSQEDSMYLTPASSPTILAPEEKESLSHTHRDNEDEMEGDNFKHSCQTRDDDNAASPDIDTVEDSPILQDQVDHTGDLPIAVSSSGAGSDTASDLDTPMKAPLARSTSRYTPDRSIVPQEAASLHGLANVDLELHTTSSVRGWDFTDKRPVMRSPSALFQPYARYTGTQQSDRQTYNVEVTILTIDMDQCTMSGYLLIRGLTPEHPKLQTFFTGEIVGGPNQRYSFKTMDSTWGANDKVDLQHWLRFPPWRHLTSRAKKDMAFDFPLGDESWYAQEHIFMRWKEHFLVPDHKQSNIQGASFEGFYYICLNQLEGKISGVYFHSKSEKYQQLELTHITKKGLGIFGVSPLVELR